MYERILKSANLKNTKVRNLLLEIFTNCNTPLCAEELYIKLNKEINIATIYRNLNLLTDKKVLKKVVSDNGKMYYKLNNNTHTHRLICNVCHSIKFIENCPMELISKNITENTGFLITSHNLELKGICSKCNNQT